MAMLKRGCSHPATMGATGPMQEWGRENKEAAYVASLERATNNVPVDATQEKQ